MVAKPSGGAPEATWEPSLKQDASKTAFLTILAPFWDPLWDNFGVILGIIVFDVFLRWLFDGFGLHFASPGGSREVLFGVFSKKRENPGF